MKMATCGQRTATETDYQERERTLLDQLPQVGYLAQRIRQGLPQCVALEDLVNAGVLGLIDAYDKFKPQRHVQLKSYAAFRIRGAILDSLREMDWGPRGLRSQSRRMEEAHFRLKAKLCRTASQAELAAEMGISIEKFYLLMRDLQGLELSSFNEQPASSGGEDDREYHERQLATQSEEDDPLFLVGRQEMSELLKRALGELPEKERQTLLLYYYEERSMKEVGQALRVSESRISQLRSSALLRLRTLLGNFSAR